VSDTLGQPIYDVATLSGGDNPTGTITWDVYAAGACSTSLHTVSEMVNGDGTYNSPTWVPTTVGTYQWVAKYSGDANNAPAATLCNDPNEQSSVQQTPAPGISLVKLERDGSSGSFTHGPITGNVGDTIDYQMTVVNTGNTRLVIAFTDPHCDAGTLSVPTVISGVFEQATSTLAPGGELQYTCSHVLQTGDAPQFANTASVTGQPPQGPAISATDTVVALLNTPSTPLTPGIKVVKLQRDGSSGSFTTAPITAKVGDTIQYEIQVTNTGTAPLSLTLSDPRCAPGTISGPMLISGTLNGNVLEPDGEAQYTCSHVLTASDSSPFTNTATVTGQPPSGPPVSGTSSVVANKQAVLPVTIKKCPKGKVKRTKKVHGKTQIACVAKKRPIISRAPLHPSGFTG
jgi:plastocyanin